MAFIYKKSLFSIFFSLVCCLGIYVTNAMEQDKGTEKQLKLVSPIEALSLDLKAYNMDFLMDEDDIEKVVENMAHLAETSKKMHYEVNSLLGYIMKELSKKFNRNLIDIAMAFKARGFSWLHANSAEKESLDSFLEAIEKGETALIQFILSAGVDVNISDSSDNIALHTAVYYGNKEIVKLLVKAGADVNKPTKKDKNTPLHFAARVGHKDIVELLVDTGASVNQANAAGNIPLHEAASRNHKEIVKLLLQHKADVNKAGSAGSTPLHYAAGNVARMIETIEDVEVIELLLDAGANLNAQDSKGRTPLHSAALTGQKNVVEFLLQRGADACVKDKDGISAAGLAKVCCYHDIADLLDRAERSQFWKRRITLM